MPRRSNDTGHATASLARTGTMGRGRSVAINAQFPEHVPKTDEARRHEELTSVIQEIAYAPRDDQQATMPLPNPARTGNITAAVQKEQDANDVCAHLIARTVHRTNYPYIILWTTSILVSIIYVVVRIYYISQGFGSYEVPANLVIQEPNLTLGDVADERGIDIAGELTPEFIEEFPILQDYVDDNTYSYWWSVVVLAAEIGGSLLVHYSQQMFIRQITFFYKMDPEQEHRLADVVRSKGKLQRINIMVCTYSEPMETVRLCCKHLLDAPAPSYTEKVIYIGDDGAKKKFPESEQKRQMAEEFQRQGHQVIWVGDRKALPHQLNGKSSNINHMVLNKMFPHVEKTADVPLRDILMVMDCDHFVQPDYFAKSCAVMLDPGVAVCLMPQAFHNEVKPDCFDNSNYNFMFRMMPFYFGAGCCFVTGTNVMVRARAAFEACRFDDNPHAHETQELPDAEKKEMTATLGGDSHRQLFSEVLVAEDIELGSRVHTLGYRSVFLDEVLALGEVPLGARDIWKQRSRWAKAAHMYVLDPESVFWYKQKNMSFWQKSLYWIPIVLHFHVIFVEPIMFLMPIMCLAGDICPYGVDTLLWVTHFLKLLFTVLVSSYAPSLELTQAAIFGQTMARVLFWVNVKAVLNTIMVYTGYKKPGAFKVTTKAAAPKAEGDEVVASGASFNFDHADADSQALALSSASVAGEGQAVAEGSNAGPTIPKVLDRLKLYRIHDSLSKVSNLRAKCLPFEGTLDFWVLLFITGLNLASVGIGIVRLSDKDALFSFAGCESQNIQMIALVFAFIEATPGLLFFGYMAVQGTKVQFLLKLWVPLIVGTISVLCFLIELRVGIQYLATAVGQNWDLPIGDRAPTCAPAAKPRPDESGI